MRVTMIDFQSDIDSCLKVLREGGTILYPTDTIWGIGCDASNTRAVEKIYALKNRSKSNGLIVLLAEIEDLKKYIPGFEPALNHLLETHEKPTTVIYPRAKFLAPNLMQADGSVAIRIVKEAFCKALIKLFEKPLVSTSANISGEPPPECFRQIAQSVIEGVDYVVRYRQTDTTSSKPSTILKYNIDGTLTVLRP
jgi:L-threonylcarbamoyladenylate synthase